MIIKYSFLFNQKNNLCDIFISHFGRSGHIKFLANTDRHTEHSFINVDVGLTSTIVIQVLFISGRILSKLCSVHFYLFVCFYLLGFLKTVHLY